MRRLLFVAPLLLAVASGCTETEPPEAVFIALQRDFAGFESWPRYFVGNSPLPGHSVGDRFGYIKQLAPKGAAAYPVGSIIVKTVESGATKQEWALFAMAKRGGGFNAAGAKDWEFFTLRFSTSGVPVIVSRGSNPADGDADGDADGGTTGGGYGSTGSGSTCNRCHGLPGTEQLDYVLSAVLRPGAQ